MTMSEMLLPEFDQEARTTRTFLERVPMERADWRPHEKSFTLGQLANHLATLSGFGVMALSTPELDLASGSRPRPPSATTREELLANFDQAARTFRAALASASDDDLAQVWRMTRGEQVVREQPRLAFVRSGTMNHMVHHRAQLGVYLRMLDVPVPSAYGPTADEQ